MSNVQMDIGSNKRTAMQATIAITTLDLKISIEKHLLNNLYMRNHHNKNKDNGGGSRSLYFARATTATRD